MATTPRLLLTMLRNLPEGSRYASAISSAPEALAAEQRREAQEPDPTLEERFWTQDRLLMAQLINSVNTLVQFTIQWPEGKQPKLPLIGPSKWRGDGNKSAKPLSVMDVLNKVTGNNGR